MKPRGFKAIVRVEAVLDRAQTLNLVNLADMAMEYPGVLPPGEVESWLDGQADADATRSG